MSRQIMFEGKKATIVKEDLHSLYVLVLEDNLFKNAEGRFSFIQAGRIYRFCKCCFDRHVREEVS